MKRRNTVQSGFGPGPVEGAPAQAAALAEIRPGQTVQLLKELHILTRDGVLNQDSRRKLKQVYHLYQLIEPLLLELADSPAGISLADHGAGKSYLGRAVAAPLLSFRADPFPTRRSVDARRPPDCRADPDY